MKNNFGGKFVIIILLGIVAGLLIAIVDAMVDCWKYDLVSYLIGNFYCIVIAILFEIEVI